MSNKEEKSHNTCGICNDNTSKYCCPKCEVLYCSLECYKSDKHRECSENFYRDCVNEELASHQTDDESKQKMIEILKRMHKQDLNDQDTEELLDDDIDNEEESIDSDDYQEDDLHERIKDLNLEDPDEVWNALTQDERNEFEALLSNGDVGSIMPQWEPWWMYREEEMLIENISDKDERKKDAALNNCPPIKEMPKLNSMTNVQPSPVIKFNITNVLGSYAFIMRYFNGDTDPVELVTYLFEICANLNSQTNFEDPAIAIESVSQKCLQSQLVETDEISLHTMKHDTYLILQGPSNNNKLYYCKSALSHLRRMLVDAKDIKKLPKNSKNQNEFSKKFPEHQRDHLPGLDVSKIKKSVKKIEYYLSFVDSYGMEYDVYEK